MTTRPDPEQPDPEQPDPAHPDPEHFDPEHPDPTHPNPTGDQPGRPPVGRPRRTDEEWEAVFRDDLRTSLATERRLVWMELVALAAVAVVVALHFVWR